jgi:hypothetical protein
MHRKLKNSNTERKSVRLQGKYAMNAEYIIHLSPMMAKKVGQSDVKGKSV